MEMTATPTSIFDQISVRIIKEQELLIGPLAWTEAKKVIGLQIIDQQKGQVRFEGDPKEVLSRLVGQYSRLFGRASTEVCRQAVQDLIVEIPKEQVPEVLQ
ncbi:MAG TPA: hypothetical protein PKD79_02190 [Candidatus Doudnabacteria bacterium]|nr:hypothetical protein [Candidatus Doudnabacteria bacterium]